MYLKVIIIGFFLGFSGFSIISQAYSFTYKYPVSMKKYINRKILQGFIGAALSALFYKLAPFNFIVQTTANNYSFNMNFIFIITITLLFIPYLIYRIRILFYSS